MGIVIQESNRLGRMKDEREDFAVSASAAQRVYDHAVVAIKQAILHQQGCAARQVNQVQLALYFGIGKYVSDNSRSGYWSSGAIDYISRKLKSEMPGLRGFSPTNIKLMRLFYEAWCDVLSMSPSQLDATQCLETEDVAKSSVATDDLVVIPAGCHVDANVIQDFTSISFSHHCLVINKVKERDERLFYIRLCSAQKLTVSQLKTAIGRDEYRHRGQMPNNFAASIGDSRLALKAVEMFRDSYMLDFINVEELGVRDIEDVDERVVENAIVQNIRNFIMTFGHGFSFIGNQYRIEVSGKEHYIDLLFFNRELSALVAVELKTGPFKAAYLGQLNLYLQLLDDFVKKPHENPSIGIILCKDAEKSYVEYAVRDYAKPMGVATYLTGVDVPEKLLKALPDAESLKKLL